MSWDSTFHEPQYSFGVSDGTESVIELSTKNSTLKFRVIHPFRRARKGSYMWQGQWVMTHFCSSKSWISSHSSLQRYFTIQAIDRMWKETLGLGWVVHCTKHQDNTCKIIFICTGSVAILLCVVYIKKKLISNHYQLYISHTDGKNSDPIHYFAHRQIPANMVKCEGILFYFIGLRNNENCHKSKLGALSVQWFSDGNKKIIDSWRFEINY